MDIGSTKIAPWKSGETRSTSPASAEPAAPGGRFGWYAWAGARWLEKADDPAWLADFVRHGNRILLSFTAAEIADLAAGGSLAGRLERFLARAHGQGIAVDLLLGDPGWLSPAGRGGLLDIVHALSAFPFDGLHLDLERSQLPAAQRRHYPGWLADTLREAGRASPWPLALTVHYREARATALVEALREAGLKELCLMAYSGNPQRVRRILAPVLARHPRLPIAVAQSVEPGLSAEESLASRGAASALAALETIEQELRRYPNFAGVRVQSLEDFASLPP